MSDEYVNDVLVLLASVARHRGDAEYWTDQTQERIATWCGPSMTQPRVSELLSTDEEYGMNSSHFAKTAAMNGFRYRIYKNRRFNIDVIYDGLCNEVERKDFLNFEEIVEIEE